MIHPKTELRFINDVVGYGVVAKEFIPAGTITWVLDGLDREFTPEDVSKMDPLFQDIIETYTYRNNRGNLVLCWDNGRYVNHSFNSSCLTTAYDFEIAVRDIYPGEQLTDDYGYLNISYPFRAIDEGTKRKLVYPNDLLKYHQRWDRKLRENFPKIIKVDQALDRLISQEKWSIIREIISGERRMDSILVNYYNPKGKEIFEELNHGLNNK